MHGAVCFVIFVWICDFFFLILIFKRERQRIFFFSFQERFIKPFPFQIITLTIIISNSYRLIYYSKFKRK